MVLTKVEGFVPYGEFKIRFDERNNLFVVVKGKSKIVFRSKSKGKVIRMAIKLDKKSKR